MALTDKNIVITPNRGQSADPKIDFVGASSTLGPQTISLNVYPTSNGTLSFEGSAGQLFSVTNSLTGTIYSVNDVSGIPSIEVLDTGLVKLAQYSGNILIGTGTDDGSKLQVRGSLRTGNNGWNSSPASTAFSHTIAANSGTNRTVNFDGNGTLPSVWWTNGSRPYGAIDAQDPGLTFWAHNGSNWQKQITLNYGSVVFETTLQNQGYQVLHANNYNSYSPTLTGGGASGTWGISITGNAATITNQANSATITASAGINGNEIVRRSAEGYIYANHVNFNTSVENPSIANFITDNGDGWSRKSSLDHVKNSIRGVADGTWAISITGNADTVDGVHAVSLLRAGGNNDGMDFNTLNYNTMYYAYIANSANKPTSYSYSYGTILTFDPGVGNGGRAQFYISHAGNDLTFRGGWNGNDSWQTWNRVLTDQNYNSYSPTLTGGGASGTWGINITGNAATATSATDTTKLPLSGGTLTGVTNYTGDNYSRYGPNSSWSAYLRVGGNGRVSTTDATVATTNGNLHLDSADGQNIYLNYYAGGTIYGPGGVVVLHSNNYTSYVGNGAMTVTAGSGLTGGGQLGTANQTGASSVTISHADTSSVANLSSDNSSGTVLQDIALTFDTYGHVTGASAGTVNLDDRYYTETEINNFRWFHSDRDFPNGTLIQTNINYAVSSGDPWVLEIRGNSYGSLIPFDIQYQGYIYSDTIINHGGYSNGTTITGLVVFNYNGNLCFWFPNQSYWHGYNVYCYVPYATYASNRVTSITNVAKPGGITKEVALSVNIRQSLHSGNYNSYSPTLTGGGASGTWGINITGNADTATTATNVSGGTVSATDITVGTSLIPATDNSGVVGTSSNTWSNGQFTNLTIDSTLSVRVAIDLADSDVLRMGSSDDWQLYYNGSTNKAQIELEAACLGIQFTDNGTEIAYLEKTTGNFNTIGAITQAGNQVLHAANYNSYAPTLTGGGASGTWGISITGSAPASGLTGQTGMWTSATRPGPYRLYRRDDDSNYSVQTYWTGSYWRLYGYSGDSAHADTHVGYSDSSGYATSAIRLVFNDGPRNLSDRLPNTSTRTVNFDFVYANTGNGTGNYAGVMSFSPWTGTTASTGDSSYQLAFANASGVNASGQPKLSIRNGIDTTWNAWYTLLHSGNYTDYVGNGTLTVQGSNGLTGSGTFTANQTSNATITISHSDTSAQASVNNSNGTVIQDITLDTYGHITALGSVNLDTRYLPTFGGTVNGQVTINADANGVLTIGNNSSNNFITLVRTDGGVSNSSVYNGNGNWWFEHRPVFNGYSALDTANYSSYALPLSGGTMTGAISFVSGQKYYETYTTFSSSGGSLTINCNSGSVFQVTLTENVTSTTFSNAPSSGTAYGFTLRIIQGSPARTITWPAAVDWPSGTAPTLSSGSGDVDVFVFFTTDGGTTWYGFTAGQDLS